MSLAYQTSKNVIISASADETILIWDFPTGEILCVLESHTNWVRGVQLSANSGDLLSCSYDNTLIHWKFVEKRYPEYVKTLTGHTYFVTVGKFISGDSQIVSSSYDGSAKIWDSKSGYCIETMCHSNNSRINHMEISPDEKWMATAGEDGNVCIWCMLSYTRKFVVSHRDSVRWVVFSSNSNELFSASEDKLVNSWGIQSGRMLKQFSGHTDQVNECIIYPHQCGYFMISASNDKTIKIWSHTGSVLQTEIHSSPVVVLARQNVFLASASRDRSVSVWKMRT
mmetsp:Transcript_14250/g.18055  ORF Transcript_14250/g.18055 Transcript_14250/m.18055 type:complete len:282 (-) Transcript_14250:1905-2750(-)